MRKMTAAPASPDFPGQVPVIDFELEQVRVLASPFSSEVFWSFSPDKPFAANDIARDIGKTSATVGYHIKKLLEVGLLIPTGTRKKRSRTETLYIHAAKNFFSKTVGQSDEYLSAIVDGFKAVSRNTAREYEEFHKTLPLDSSFREFLFHRRNTLYLDSARLQALRARYTQFLQEALDLSLDAEEAARNSDVVRLTLTDILVPTVPESIRRREAAEQTLAREGNPAQAPSREA